MFLLRLSKFCTKDLGRLDILSGNNKKNRGYLHRDHSVYISPNGQ